MKISFHLNGRFLEVRFQGNKEEIDNFLTENGFQGKAAKFPIDIREKKKTEEIIHTPAELSKRGGAAILSLDTDRFENDLADLCQSRQFI